MDLTILKQKLLTYGKSIGLKIQEEDTNRVVFHTMMNAEKVFKSSIYCRIVVYESGTFHFFLTFDEVEKTSDNLFIVNDFNDNDPWFKCSITNINDHDYLQLHYCGYQLKEEKDVVSTVGFLLNSVIEKETVAYIKALTEKQ